MLLKIFKISGHSMMPTFFPDDRVLATSFHYLFVKPKKEDVIVFKYRDKYLIKKIVEAESNEFFVKGENKKDSLKIEKVKREDILGKVIMKI